MTLSWYRSFLFADIILFLYVNLMYIHLSQYCFSVLICTFAEFCFQAHHFNLYRFILFNLTVRQPLEYTAVLALHY